MAYREDTRVTPAEAASFALVPETCPEIEAALSRLGQSASTAFIEIELRSRGIEPDRRLVATIQDIQAKATATARHEVRQTVLMRGTFPLRLALVQQLEKTMPGPHPESRYVRWLGA